MVEKTNKVNVELTLGQLFTVVTALIRNSQRLMEMGAHSSLTLHQLELAETLNVILADNDYDKWDDNAFYRLREEALKH
jgi:hypothetical protein